MLVSSSTSTPPTRFSVPVRLVLPFGFRFICISLTVCFPIDNVLDHIARLKSQIRNPKDFQENAQDYLLGQVVLTRYNNRTYHIDGIAWDLNPNSTFKLANGDTITYREYYEKTYSRPIRDLTQPLLLNKAKKKVRKGDKGATIEETIYLVPELCSMTGLYVTFGLLFWSSVCVC